MKIVVAPNAFKNSCTAQEAAEAIAEGLRAGAPGCEPVLFPVGDGGDGTGPLLTQRLGGEIVRGMFSDPLGRPVEADYGWLADSRTAVIEMASASGLRLLARDERDPLRVSSTGSGEMIVAALDRGAGKIIFTVGGSATVDGGAGLLHALGLRFLDADGLPLSPLPADLERMRSIDPASFDARLRETSFEVWCDVRNPLLGPSGAAAIFGPQKGAGPEAVKRLEAVLARLAALTREATGADIASLAMGGAAGGVAAFLQAWFGATLTGGIDAFLAAGGFSRILEGASLAITGEGGLDAQTLEGKAPYGVAKAAAAQGIPTVALAGLVAPELCDGAGIFREVIGLSVPGRSLARALEETRVDLRRAARALAISWTRTK